MILLTQNQPDRRNIGGHDGATTNHVGSLAFWALGALLGPLTSGLLGEPVGSLPLPSGLLVVAGLVVQRG